jgi:hypothetical protein
MINLRTYKWLNAALFQIGWFCCILGSNTIAICVTAVFLGIHLTIVNDKKQELLFICTVTVVGFSLDYILSTLGYIRLSMDGSFPLFLVCLWFLFASTLNWSYSYLVSKVYIAIVAGLVTPLSYLAAQKMGKIEYLKSGVECFIVHALMWVGFMVVIHFIKNKKGPLNYAR